MVSIIIHVDEPLHVASTINSILLSVPSDLLHEIILVDDTNGLLQIRVVDPVRVMVNESRLGRAASRNRAAAVAGGDILIFIHHTARPLDNWLQPLLAAVELDNQVVAGPLIRSLDTNLWTAEVATQLKWGWRWNLELYPAYDDGSEWAVCLSPHCLVISRDWFAELGGFDEIGGGPEQLEFCVRAWLCGGAIMPVRSSTVAVAAAGQSTDIVSVARCAEAWFGPQRARFYAARGLAPGDVRLGKLDVLSSAQSRLQSKDIRWLLDRFQPELGRIYDLRRRYHGKSAAIVCDGPSVDLIDRWAIARHDVVIGIDYMASLYDCDFSVFLHRDPAIAMAGSVARDRMVLPPVLLGPDGLPAVAAAMFQGATFFELGQPGVDSTSLDPPFVNYGHPLFTALQFAAFLGVARVVVYGWDGRLVSGKSHTARLAPYNEGEYWAEGEATERRFTYYAGGMERICRLLAAHNIPVLKLCHA